MTKSQYYKWRSKLRQVYRRQDFDCDYGCESIIEIAQRLFSKSSEKERNILIETCDKSENQCKFKGGLSWRLIQYKAKKKNKDPWVDIIALKMKESEEMLKRALAKQLFG